MCAPVKSNNVHSLPIPSQGPGRSQSNEGMPFVPFNAVTSDDSGQWIGGQWKEAKFVETEEDFEDELLFLDVSEEKVSRKFLL